jgi:hypothetical protein
VVRVLRTQDGDVLPWLVAALCLEVLDLTDDALAVDDFTEHDVLLVQVRCVDGRDEELRAVGAWPSVGHTQQKRLLVQSLEILVLKFLAIDALSARAVALGEVTALDHEALDHAVEARALVVQRLAGLAHALFAST